jgi:putative nucleotidyltransferase with HDIG domain
VRRARTGVAPVLSAVGLAVTGALVVFLILSWEFVANELFTRQHQTAAVVGSIAPRSLYSPAEIKVTLPSSGREALVLRGEKIVSRGDRITADQAAIIEAMISGTLSVNLSPLAGNLVLTLAMLTVLLAHVVSVRERLEQRTNVPLLVAIIVGILAGAKLAVANAADVQLMFLINPIPIAAILMAIFISTEMAVIGTIVLAILSGVLYFSPTAPTGSLAQFQLTAYALLGGITGIFSVSRRQSERSDIIRSGFAVSLTNVVTVVAFNLIFHYRSEPLTFWAVFDGAGFGLGNGVFCSMLVLGLLPFVEEFFHVTTSTRLLELINPGQPLLQKLITEAPGTFHHSQNVAHLAEKAAEAIGADPYLAKAAAYYHDLGKVRRPHYFIENQMGGPNYHDSLSPQLSKLIIHSHTRDGVELGEKYGLPKAITDIMVEHHGTDLVAFFYHRARQAETEMDEVQEESYRYPGPKPQSKEAAIIMLSDAVEAASRTLRKPTPQAIENLVSKIINDKFVDGQFDECDLTKKDCEEVADCFSTTLMAMYHSRIQYPTELAEKVRAQEARVLVPGAPAPAPLPVDGPGEEPPQPSRPAVPVSPAPEAVPSEESPTPQAPHPPPAVLESHGHPIDSK